MTPQETTLQALISPVITEAGFELVRLRITGSQNKVLQIMAESPDGTMTAQNCARLSRAISIMMDENDPIKDRYTLEVSSPGIDRPLTRLKDFARWDGFVAKIELTHLMEGQKRFRGTLAGIDGEDVCIDLQGEEETAMIPFSMIATAKLVLTDELVNESLRSAKKDANAEADTDEDQDIDTDADANQNLAANENTPPSTDETN